MFINIDPFDTLFFRTGLPFSAGTDTWSGIAFPPAPSTFYGALRSFLIFNYGMLEDFESGRHKYRNYIGYIENKNAYYGSLVIKGIYFWKKRDNLIYFASPKDLLKIKKREKTLYLLAFKEKPTLFISDYSLESINIWERKDQVDDAEGWMDVNTFRDYLIMKECKFRYTEQKDLFEFEPKIGIARDRETFTSKEGYLYRIPFIRPNKDISFLIEVEGIETNMFPQTGVMQLGGEGKAVKFEFLSDDPLKEIKDLNLEFNNGYFKIYLATPAVFKNGWYPEWIDKNSFEGNYNGIKVKLVACALGKPVSIGGWDLANQNQNQCGKQLLLEVYIILRF